MSNITANITIRDIEIKDVSLDELEELRDALLKVCPLPEKEQKVVERVIERDYSPYYRWPYAMWTASHEWEIPCGASVNAMTIDSAQWQSSAGNITLSVLNE